MSPSDEIVRCTIHPAVGIARVGSSSDGYFLANEVCGRTPAATDRFKDAQGRFKRQAALFRIYGYDAEGKVVRELTADDAVITWRVHVANRKAGWYQFNNAMDLGERAKPASRRNAQVTDRRSLVIDPGRRTISGRDRHGPAFQLDGGNFLGLPVGLGELRTDASGRLVVFGGHGVSRSRTGGRATTFANNDGWHDDVSDGPVRATVELAGRRLEADPAWVAVAPPNYGPSLTGVVSMYDLLVDLFHRTDHWPVPERPSFWRDIHPILHRLSALEAVNRGFFVLFGPASPVDFRERSLLVRLADPSPVHAALRQQIFTWFRDPDATDEQADSLPPIYGDLFGDFADVAGTQLSVTRTQYRLLRLWAAGDFTSEPAAAPPPARIEDLPIADQPHALDRVHLESCLGGPFHPGIELTWTLRLRSMWRVPFRLSVLPEGAETPDDYGPVLMPEAALGANGPFQASGPGMLTAFLGVPWQTDEASCDAGYQAGTYLPLPSYWAARVPNHVLPELAYERLVDESLTTVQRMKHYNIRPAWLRHFGSSYEPRINSMVERWDNVGVVAERPAPADHAALGLPPTLLVETELARSLPADDPSYRQVLRAENKSTASAGPTGAASVADAAGATPPRHSRRTFGRGEV